MHWQARGIDLLLKALRALPPRVAWRLGAGLGQAYAQWPGRDVRRAREHLAQAFPDRSPAWCRQQAANCFRHIGRMALWCLGNLRRDSRGLAARVPVEGAGNARATLRDLAAGRGVLAVSAHLGNWELAAQVLGAVLPLTILGRHLRYPGVDQAIVALRADGGRNRVIFQDEGLAVCLRELRAGRMMATLPDQDVSALAGCFVPFFGRLAYSPIGPATMAVMTRRPIQPIYCYERAGRWVLHWGPQMFPRGSGDRVADAVELTARYTAYQEAFMRRCIPQWVWWHKRWRNAPADRPKAPVFRP